jgi:hypothetical protein
MGTFGVELGRNVVRAKKASHAVIALSIEQMITLAQLPIHQGGRMPILTGALRASLRIQLMGSGAMFQGLGAQYPAMRAMANRDVVRIRWMARYASFQEKGWKGNVGKHFASNATAQFPRLLRINTERFNQNGL